MEIQEANDLIVVKNPLYGSAKLSAFLLRRIPKISFKDWVNRIHEYVLVKLKKCAEPIEVIALLRNLEIEANLFKVSEIEDKVVNAKDDQKASVSNIFTASHPRSLFCLLDSFT